jgi:hypothetical protein
MLVCPQIAQIGLIAIFLSGFDWNIVCLADIRLSKSFFGWNPTRKCGPAPVGVKLEPSFNPVAQNDAFCHTILLAFFLYEAFKEDVCVTVLDPIAQPTTFRREIIDIAAEIVHHAGRVVLKVPEAILKPLYFDEL